MNADTLPASPRAETSLEDSSSALGLRDSSLRLLLLIAFVLQLLTWSQLDGYQLADSVEYMERAQALVRGEEVIDSVAIRGYGFVSLFAPIFALADFFGVENFTPVVSIARLFQMLLGLELIRITVLLGSRLAGRQAGLAAGLAVGLNPFFLLYSASPVSGIAAGVCIGHALSRLIFRTDFRGALIGGLWLGGALLVAYKTILLTLPIIGLVFLADRFARWRSWVGASAGYALGVLGAISLDKLCYGVWGQSIDLYVRQNFGQIATRLSLRLGFQDLATWFWEFTGGDTTTYSEAPLTTPRELLKEPNPLYHLTHLDEMVVWPLLLLGVLALAHIVLRGKRATRILAAVFVVSIAAVSMKKSTDFRLLLPTLPCIGALCGLGWQRLFGERANQKAATVVGALVLSAAGVLGWLRLGEINNTTFSGYWRAMDRVNHVARERSAASSHESDLRVACAWHWAVFLRESSSVELIKLPHQLDRWPMLDEQSRADSLRAIEELDCFISHIAVLLGSPNLFRAINAQFEVDAVLYDREVFDDLGPIVIFKRRTGETNALSFQSRTTGVAPADYIREHKLRSGREFAVGESGTANGELELLGWKLQPLPGNGHAWLSLHWLRSSVDSEHNYVVRPRLLTRFVELPWEEQHLLGRSFHPPNNWSKNEIVSEGWPVVAAVAPFDWQRPWQPIYGDQPAGSRYPATFWLRLIPVAEGGKELAPLVPIVQPDTEAPEILPDGFVRIGEVELVVPADRD